MKKTKKGVRPLFHKLTANFCKRGLTPFLVFLFFSGYSSFAAPLISGISTNEINIDTNFQGARILLFGAKGDAGNIVIAVRGPKKNFLVTKKERLLGIWHNGERVKFKEAYSFYQMFFTFSDQNLDQETIDQLLGELELGKNNLPFQTSEKHEKTKEEFKIKLIENLEKNNLYSDTKSKIDFLDETLFKVIIDFPKNITRGVYNVEIYLISEGGLTSFQSIPVYVNQVGLAAKILDFAYRESFLYGIFSIIIALVVGWLANYIFVKFIGR